MAAAKSRKINFLNPKRIDFSFINQLAKTAREQNTFPVVVHYLSDNAGDTTDTAPLEIVTRLEDINAQLEAILKRTGPRVQYHNIPSQDTFAASFDLAQASRGNSRGFGNVFFVNCAPRKKQAGVHKKNGGEKIYAGILPNGTIVAGTGEDAFTHFKDLIKAGKFNVYEAEVQTDKSQFRSRDIFPYFAQILGWHVGEPSSQKQWKQANTLEKREEILFGLQAIKKGRRLELDEIPDLPNGGAIVQRRDIHLNAKTGLCHDDIKKAFRGYQRAVVYSRGGQAVRAHIVRDSFEKKAGDTVISAGSSGRWEGANGKTLSAFAEIFTVGEKAIKKLGVTDDQIRNGAELHIIPEELFDKAKLLAPSNKYGPSTTETDTYLADYLVTRDLVKGTNFDALRRAVAKKVEL